MPTIMIVYDSKTGNTKAMARSIAQGASTVEGVNVVLRKIGDAFPLSELETADAIFFGSPSIYSNMTVEMKVLLESIEELSKYDRLNLRGKIGVAFGTYGWDGGWALERIFRKAMEDLGITLFDQVLLAVGKPNEAILEKCSEIGRKVAEEIKKKTS